MVTAMAGVVMAQNERGWLRRDVAVLVDVSASVIQQDWKNDDKEIVRKVIMGLRRDSDLGSDWVINTELGEEVVAPYYREGLADGSMPLLESGNSLIIMRFGDLKTIRESVMESRPITNVEADTRAYFEDPNRGYPRYSSIRQNNEFTDQKTNITLAKAKVHRLMAREEGYYLIVVSDEDPDEELEKLTADELTMIREWEGRTGVTNIVTLRRRTSQLKISLRAVGFDPDPNVQIKRAQRYTPPEPKLAIEFLGALGESTETFPHRPLTDPPYLAWQVNEDREAPREFMVKLEPIEGQNTPPAMVAKASFVVYDRAELDGKYRVKVESVASGVAPPRDAYIEIRRRWDFLPYLALVTGILSVTVFIYTWWTLRQS